MSGEGLQGLRIGSSLNPSKCHPERNVARVSRPVQSQNLRSSLLLQTMALFLLVCLTSSPVARAAQKIKDADCLTCHGDASLITEENGRQVSLFVDQNKLKHSFHGRLFGCVDCHTDVKSLAHDAPPKKITCAGCHEADDAADGAAQAEGPDGPSQARLLRTLWSAPETYYF